MLLIHCALLLLGAVSFARAQESPTATEAAPSQPAPTPVLLAKAGVRLTPPPGFKLSEKIEGLLQNEEAKASIMAVPFNSPFLEAAQDLFDEETLKAKGITLVKKEIVVVQGRTAILGRMTQTANEIPYMRLNLLIGNETESVLIVANYPEAMKERLEEPVTKCLMNTDWLKIGTMAASGAAPFEVTEAGDLKAATYMLENRIYTTNGVYPRESPEVALLIIGPTLNRGIALGREETCERFLKQLSMAVYYATSSSVAITVDGLDGFEMTGKARDPGTTEQMILYQAVLYVEDYAYTFSGVTSEKDGEKNLELFRKMTRSFKRVKLD